MSGSKKNKKVELVTETPAHGHPVRRFIVTVAILAAVFYVGIYLACGTDGFRSYAEEYLGTHLGLPVRVKKIHATPTLDIVLNGVMTEGVSRKGTPGYRVQEAVVHWSVLNKVLSRGEILSGLELNDFSVSFAPGESGDWEPAALAKLGSWVADWGRFNLSKPSAAVTPDDPEKADDVDAAPAPTVKSDFWDRISLAIENGSMSWWDGDKRELASAAGIKFDITPISLPNRKMTHYILTLENANVGGQKSVRDFTFEMLKMQSNSIVITCAGDWGTGGGDERRSTSE
jgi:hypothetical protein